MNNKKVNAGILVIDKPKGLTSRAVVNILNKLLFNSKIGHTGTLDPLATGVLVITIGKYTKLANILTSMTKEYIAEITLGIKTDTGDITGNIIKQNKSCLTKKNIANVLKSFVGEYEEIIPLYSAVKIKGKRLYQYARQNIKVDLPTKKVMIEKISLISFKDNKIIFKCLVSKGTYIRSLIADICQKLGTLGTMSNLRRIKQGKFSLANAYSLEDIKNGCYAFCDIKDYLDYQVVKLNSDIYNKVKNGSKITNDFNITDKVIFSYNLKYVAIYEKDGEILRPYIML